MTREISHKQLVEQFGLLETINQLGEFPSEYEAKFAELLDLINKNNDNQQIIEIAFNRALPLISEHFDALSLYRALPVRFEKIDIIVEKLESLAQTFTHWYGIYCSDRNRERTPLHIEAFKQMEKIIPTYEELHRISQWEYQGKDKQIYELIKIKAKEVCLDKESWLKAFNEARMHSPLEKAAEEYLVSLAQTFRDCVNLYREATSDKLSQRFRHWIINKANNLEDAIEAVQICGKYHNPEADYHFDNDEGLVYLASCNLQDIRHKPRDEFYQKFKESSPEERDRIIENHEFWKNCDWSVYRKWKEICTDSKDPLPEYWVKFAESATTFDELFYIINEYRSLDGEFQHSLIPRILTMIDDPKQYFKLLNLNTKHSILREYEQKIKDLIISKAK